LTDSSADLFSTVGGALGASQGSSYTLGQRDEIASIEYAGLSSDSDDDDDEHEFGARFLERDESNRDLSVPNLTDYDLIADKRDFFARFRDEFLCNGEFYKLLLWHAGTYYVGKMAIQHLLFPGIKRRLRSIILGGGKHAGEVYNLFNPTLMEGSQRAAAFASSKSGVLPSKIEDIIAKALDNKALITDTANKGMSFAHSLMSVTMSFHFWRKYRRTMGQAQDPCHYRYAPDELRLLDHSIAYTIVDMVWMYAHGYEQSAMYVHHVSMALLCIATRLGGFGAPATNIALLGAEAPTLVMNVALATRELMKVIASIISKFEARLLLSPTTIARLRDTGLHPLKSIANALRLSFVALFVYMRFIVFTKVFSKALWNVSQTQHLNGLQNATQVSQMGLLLVIGYVWGYAMVKRAIRMVKKIIAHYQSA
jgi:hypothetical protein